MKKYLFSICLTFCLFASLSNAGQIYLGTSNVASQYIKSSGATAVSKSLGYGKCLFYGILVSTDGTNDVVVNVYDNTSASGKMIIPPIKIIGADNFGGVFLPIGILVNTNIYVNITGTGGIFEVYYEDGK